MEREKVVVVGGGIVGVCSAYYLNLQGYSVTLIEKNAQLAPKGSSSYQNGALVCPGLAGSHSSGKVKKGVWKSFWEKESTFKVVFGRHLFDGSLIKWLSMYWRYASQPQDQYQQRWKNIYSLAQQSSFQYKKLISKYPHLQGPASCSTVLETFLNEDQYHESIKKLNSIRESLSLPPVIPIASGDNAGPIIKKHYFPQMEESYAKRLRGVYETGQDTSGDCRKFTRELGKICKKEGVQFKLDETVQSISYQDNKILSVTTDKGEYKADKFVFSTGATTALLKSVGLYVPVAPIKGYTLQFPIHQKYLDMETTSPSGSLPLIPSASIGEDGRSMYVTRIGPNIRIGGFAEINGFNRDPDEGRFNTLEKYGRLIMGDVVDWSKRKGYACLRPVSADGNPIIGSVPKFENLYLNMGHGTLGWTLACGSADLLTQVMSSSSPQQHPFSIDRFSNH